MASLRHCENGCLSMQKSRFYHTKPIVLQCETTVDAMCWQRACCPTAAFMNNIYTPAVSFLLQNGAFPLGFLRLLCKLWQICHTRKKRLGTRPCFVYKYCCYINFSRKVFVLSNILFIFVAYQNFFIWAVCSAKVNETLVYVSIEQT